MKRKNTKQRELKELNKSLGLNKKEMSSKEGGSSVKKVLSTL